MVGYVTAEVAAERWNVTVRQVQILCKCGRVDGAEQFGRAWAIPETAVKPTRTGKLKPGRRPKPKSDTFVKEGSNGNQD
jgi:hypothetical protein